MPTPSHLGRVLKIFYSYAHHDEAWRADLEKHLESLQRQGLITGWHRGEIEAGGEWEVSLKQHLSQADIILLLISSDFVASENCYCGEMMVALRRHKQGEVYVLPVLLRPTEIAGLPFAGLQFVPKDGIPITRQPDKDSALLEVVQAVKQIVAEVMGAYVSTEPAPEGQGRRKPMWWKIPHTRNPFFTGRDMLLEQLHTNLMEKREQRVVLALNGLGGIGKTQTALEYVYRYIDDYQAIFWVSADPQGDLLADFMAIARIVDLPEKNEAEQKLIVAALQTWFQQHERWLLVFDNVEDIAALSTFWPVGGHGHILITTRAQATGKLATPRELEPLETVEGARFLLQRVGLLTPEIPFEQVEQQQREAAWEITRQFAGHPLALDQAGAYLEETGQSLVDYVALYQRRQATLLSRRGEASPDHPESVMATFSLALERIQRASPAAAELLRLCAFLHPDTQPEELLMAGAAYFTSAYQELAHDSFEFNDALAALRKYSLIRRNPATKTISVHRLVQDVIKHGLDREQQRHWADATVRTLSREFPGSEAASWWLCQRYLPHARVCMQLIAEWQMRFVEAAHLLNRVGDYLFARSEYAEAQLRYEQALELLIEEEEPLRTAQVLSNLGVVGIIRANYPLAERSLRRALSVRERVLDSDHPDLAQNLNDLAGVYHNQGMYAQAEPLYQRALVIQEQTLGVENAATLRTLGNLALLSYTLAKYTEAETLNKRVLAEREKLNTHSVETGQSLLNLAHVYRMQQRYAKAEPLFTRVLALYEEIYGPEHAQTGIALNGYALLLTAQQRYEQAEPLLRRALAIWELNLGPVHPRNIGALNALATIALHQDHYAEAEQLLRRARQIQQQTSWLEYTDLTPNLKALAALYEDQDKYAEAESLKQLIATIQ